MTDKNGTPYRDSFYFGLYTCAFCLDIKPIHGKDRQKRILSEPEYGDWHKTEIIIPAGRHSFHKECLTKLEWPGDMKNRTIRHLRKYREGPA